MLSFGAIDRYDFADSECLELSHNYSYPNVSQSI